MDLWKIVGAALITAVSVMILKEYKQDMALVVAIGGGLVLLAMILYELVDVVDAFATIADKAGISNGLFSQMIKIIGIGYICEFSAEICEDAGVKSIASKIQLAGKIMILLVALPIIMSLLEIVVSLTS